MVENHRESDLFCQKSRKPQYIGTVVWTAVVVQMFVHYMADTHYFPQGQNDPQGPFMYLYVYLSRHRERVR